MKLFTKPEMQQLLENGRQSNEAIAIDGNTPNFKPVVKLFNPYGSQTWLLTELDPEYPDRGFGLCDMGFGTPELGYVSLSEMQSLDIPGKYKLERDRHFKAKYQISTYADKARIEGYIIEDF